MICSMLTGIVSEFRSINSIIFFTFLQIFKKSSSHYDDYIQIVSSAQYNCLVDAFVSLYPFMSTMLDSHDILETFINT